MRISQHRLRSAFLPACLLGMMPTFAFGALTITLSEGPGSSTVATFDGGSLDFSPPHGTNGTYSPQTDVSVYEGASGDILYFHNYPGGVNTHTIYGFDSISGPMNFYDNGGSDHDGAAADYSGLTVVEAGWVGWWFEITDTDVNIVAFTDGVVPSTLTLSGDVILDVPFASFLEGTYSSDNFAGGDGVSLVVAAAAPEPSSTALLGLGGLALMLRRRR